MQIKEWVGVTKKGCGIRYKKKRKRRGWYNNSSVTEKIWIIKNWENRSDDCITLDVDRKLKHLMQYPKNGNKQVLSHKKKKIEKRHIEIIIKSSYKFKTWRRKINKIFLKIKQVLLNFKTNHNLNIKIINNTLKSITLKFRKYKYKHST